MNAVVAAGAGFLLAVLWLDLMFDVQVLGHRGGARLPDEVLARISSYYGRVTTGATPMNRLIGLVMLATVGAVVVRLARGDDPTWAAVASLALIAAPVALALGGTFPRAVRLGQGHDDAVTQSSLARSILRDHVFCLAAVASVLALQLGPAG